MFEADKTTRCSKVKAAAKLRTIVRSRSLDSLVDQQKCSKLPEGFVHYDPRNISVAIPAESRKVWIIGETKTIVLDDGMEELRKELDGEKVGENGAQPTNKEDVSLEKDCLSLENIEQEFARYLPKTAVKQQLSEEELLTAKLSRNTPSDEEHEEVTAKLVEKMVENNHSREVLVEEQQQEKLTVKPSEKLAEIPAEELVASPSFLLATTLVETLPNSDDPKVDDGIMSPPKLEQTVDPIWNNHEGSPLLQIIKVQELKLGRDRKTMIVLQDKLGSSQKNNLKLKTEILSLEKSVNDCEHQIDGMKTVIDEVARDRDDVISEMTVSRLYAEDKIACLVDKIREFERREKITRDFMTELKNDDGEFFSESSLNKNALIMKQNVELMEQVEYVKESLCSKEEFIASLKEKLEAVGIGKNCESGSRDLEVERQKVEQDRAELLEQYERSVKEWQGIRSDMKEQNEKIYESLYLVENEKESLANELCEMKKKLNEACSCAEKYKDMLAKREDELVEMNNSLKLAKNETQRRLNEMEDEIQIVRKHNDDSYDLLEIATTDLKFLQKRNSELEECCSAKELQREESLRALDELKTSDESLKIVNVQLEQKYSEILGDMSKLTERCDKMTKINNELEDSLVSLSMKNDSLMEENKRSNKELEIATAELKKVSEEQKDLREKDSAFLAFREATTESEHQKGAAMAKEYNVLSFELAKIIVELEECREEGLNDAQNFQQRVTLMEKEKANLAKELQDAKHLEIGLQNMIRDLQSDLVKQQEIFKEESQAIVQQTADAKQQISSVAEHCKKQLVAKNEDLDRLNEVNEKLSGKIDELEETLGHYRQKNSCDASKQAKKQQTSPKSKLDKLVLIKNRLEKRYSREKSRMKVILNDVKERESRLLSSTGTEKKLRGVIERMKEELERVKNEMNVQKNNTQLAEKKIREMSVVQLEKINKLAQELSSEQGNQESLKDKIDEHQRKVNDLSEQLLKAERQNAKLHLQKEHTDKFCAALRGKIDMLHNKIDALTLELSENRSLYEQTKLQLSALRSQHDLTRKELREKDELDNKNKLAYEFKHCIVTHNDDIVIEVKRSFNNMLQAIHDQQMEEMRNELREMKRRGALRREIAMTALGSNNNSHTTMCI